MLKLSFIGLALTCAGGAQAAKFDPPDLRLELEMHRRFNQGPGPAADAAPTALAPDAYVENLKIGRGDTLWSLSKLLYGDGAYWPRVWAQNDAITNPHLVQPGHVLEFLMGSEDDAPAFRFSEEDAEGGVELTAANVGGPAVEIPPPEITPRAILKVPPSFPEWQSVYRQQPKPFLDDRSLDKERERQASRVYLRAWVEEKPLEPAGFMLENDTEAGLPVVNQYVFVKIKKTSGQGGVKMLVIQNVGRLRRTTDTFENEREAYLVQVAAEIELTEKVPAKFLRSRDREEYETWRAMVTKSTGLGTKDSALVVGELKFVDVSPSGAPGQATAQIIGSERSTSSTLYGGGDLVFLDRGSGEGLAVGQVFDVFSDRRARHRNTPVVYSPAPAGRVKIVRTSNNLATAVVVEAHDSILQGDRVRAIGSRDEGELGPETASRLPSSSDEGDDLLDDGVEAIGEGGDAGATGDAELDGDDDLSKELESI